MPRPRFKQKCALCKKNMVLMYSLRQFPICADCHLKRINEKVTDPAYQFLEIPEELYRKSSFLRNIKENFLRFGSLTENQITAFKKVVEEVKNPKPAEPEPEEPIEITTDLSPRRRKRQSKS